MPAAAAFEWRACCDGSGQHVMVQMPTLLFVSAPLQQGLDILIHSSIFVCLTITAEKVIVY